MLLCVLLQMQAWLLVACAAALATLAVAQKPGRFLSLPNPQKCASSKYKYTLYTVRVSSIKFSRKVDNI